MRKYAICCVDGCGIPIIGGRVSWYTPICVGCLPPPKPLSISDIRRELQKKGCP